MSQSSGFEIPQNYKIIKVTVERDQLVRIYKDPQIKHDNEKALNYLTKDYQGSAQFFDIDFKNGNAFISWGVQRGSPAAEDHNKKGIAAAKGKDFEKAIEHWRKAIYINRTDPDTLYNLALAYFEISNYTKAMDRCLELVEQCPIYFRAHFLLGSIYSKMRKFDQAAHYIRTGLIFQPQNTTALVNLGAIYSILKRKDEAIQCFELATAKSPKDVKAYLGLGKLYVSRNDIQNANRCFKAVLKLDPDGRFGHIAKNSIMPERSPETGGIGSSSEAEQQPVAKDANESYSMGYQQYLNCNYSKAVSYLEQYLKERSQDYKAWSLFSICLLKAGKKQQSIKAIEKALSFQAKNPGLYKQASILYDACGMPEKSAKAAMRAFEMGKNDSVTLTLLGIGKANLGQLQESGRILIDAVHKNPNNLKARYSLAHVLTQLGQNETAKQHLEEILWAESQTPLKEKARELMASIT